MGLEIERKFLMKDSSWKEGLSEVNSSFIQQGYISVHPGPTVRVRIRDNHAWLTVKGKPEGISRAEFEYKIPVNEAVELMKLTVTGVIVKRRYELKFCGKKWEIDEFLGDNEGLVLAEIELGSEEEEFEKPSWLGVEVSADNRYQNSSLAAEPFKFWK